MSIPPTHTHTFILPQLELHHEIYCDTDITSYVRIVSTTTPCPSHPHTHTFILPQLELRHEIYCDTDITSYVRLVSTTTPCPSHPHTHTPSYYLSYYIMKSTVILISLAMLD